MSATPSDMAARALALARYQRRIRVATGLLAAALAAAMAGALVLLTAVMGAPWEARIGVLLAGAAGVVLGGLWTAWLGWTAPRAARVAVQVEARFPELGDSFITAVELGLEGPAAAETSAPLARRVAAAAAEGMRDLNLREAVDARAVPRLGAAVAAVGLLLALGAAVFPTAWAGLLSRPEGPGAMHTPPGEEPPRGRPIVGPSLADVALRLEFPAHTHQSPETRAGDLSIISAPVGTRVTISASVRGEGPTASLLLDGVSRSLAVDASRRVAGTLGLSRDVTWRLRATDRSGRTMDTPECRLRAVPDRAPQVTLTEPGRNVALPEPRPVRLAYRAEDDWGVQSVTLEYRAPEAARWEAVTLSRESGRAVSGAWIWDLRPLRLVRGQTVSYRLAAADNDAISGPKTARTATFTVTVGAEAATGAGVAPQATEQAAEREHEGLEDLEREAEALGRELDEVIESLDRGELTEPERSRRAAELTEAQRRVAEQADRVSRALAESERQAEREKLPPALQEQLRELHDLLQQTMNEDLGEALKQIERALQSADPQELQSGLQQARESQQAFTEQVRQAIELLKRARLERNVSRAADLAEQLAAAQEELNRERAGLPQGRSEQAQAQAEAQRDLRQREQGLEQDLQQAAQQAEALDRETAERLEAIARQLEESGAQQRMQEAADELRQGDPLAAQQPQQMALSDLTKAAGDLRQLQGEMNAGAQQDLSRAAQELTRDALYLSREQERLMRRAESLEALNARSAAQGKAQREGVRREQEALEIGTRQLGEKLAEVAQQTPVIAPSLAREAEEIADRMGRAGREAAGGAGPQAAQTQREAMRGLNELAEALIRAGEQMQQAANAAGMQGLMQQLQGLAQQQRALNQQSQPRRGPGQTPRPEGGRGTPGDEQQRIREGLERLLQKAGEASGLLDRLGDVPGQMQDVERDLRAERHGGQTALRQQEILRRMLDAQRSVYQKDQQRRQRVAERPKPFRLPPSPPELTPRAAPPRSAPTPDEDAELPLD
ncbi:MAG: DUF4175 domain-containing protein, partial [Armatimonadetes bacterium]|nr:DUF4175 domain-containing protein [Armatimonadota bacterium]